MSAKISEYQSASDSKSLTQIDDAKFKIVAVEDSDYDDNGKTTPGVKITTEEQFEIDGESYNKLHTTRTAIVNKLRNQALRKDLADGKKIGPVRCKKVKAKQGGKDYFDLVDA